MNILLLSYLMQSFQFNYLSTTILHIIMNNLVVVLLKSSKYRAFYKDFNIAFDFPVFFNWATFSVDLVHEYFTFKLSYAKFPV